VTLNQGMFYLATGGMVLGGNGAFNATSPASGPYAGLVIFMARGNSSTVWMHGTVDADSCTAATATVKGIAYLPAGTLDITGNSNDCFATALIVWKLSNNGTTETTLVAYPGQKPPTTVTDSQVE
jgi:hypothetical protein